MSTLRIHFLGLIVHVGEDSTPNIKTHALILAAPGHAPLLVINGSDLEPPQSSAFAVLLSKGDSISLSNVPDGHATYDPAEDWSLLPSLKDLATPSGPGKTPDLHKKAKVHKPGNNDLHPHALLHFDYPEGTLTMTAFFQNQARYDKVPPVTHCVPSEVTLNVNTIDRGPVTLTITHENGEPPTAATIRENGALTIGNVSGGGRDFHMYEALIENGRLVAVSEAEPCTPPTAKEGETRAPKRPWGLPHPECSNSAWP